MAAKVKLTDRKLKSLKPARAGERDELMDAEVNGFGVRVTDKGKITFILLARYPGSNNPTRRALGEYPTDTLADAREKARTWRKFIEKGIDPRDEEERQRVAELRRKADTFDVAAEEFIKRVLPSQRRGHIGCKGTPERVQQSLEGQTDYLNYSARCHRCYQRGG